MPRAQTKHAPSIIDEIVEKLNARTPERLLSLRETMAITGLGRSTTYALIALKEHPAPIHCGKSSRWVFSEIQAYVARRIADSRREVVPLKMRRKTYGNRKPKISNPTTDEGGETRRPVLRE